MFSVKYYSMRLILRAIVLHSDDIICYVLDVIFINNISKSCLGIMPI